MNGIGIMMDAGQMVFILVSKETIELGAKYITPRNFLKEPEKAIPIEAAKLNLNYSVCM